MKEKEKKEEMPVEGKAIDNGTGKPGDGKGEENIKNNGGDGDKDKDKPIYGGGGTTFPIEK